MSDSQLDPLGPEKIAIERIRLRTERQRLVVETLLKRRELGERGKKSWREVFANPLMLAVVGGLLTVITTLVTSSFTAHQNREAEDRRAENTQRSAKQALQAELIKKFVEAPKTETVRENLRFLVDSGLLPDYADGIKGYLKDNPNSAPTIAPLVGSCRGSRSATIAQRVTLAVSGKVSRHRHRQIRATIRLHRFYDQPENIGNCSTLRADLQSSKPIDSSAHHLPARADRPGGRLIPACRNRYDEDVGAQEG